MASLKFRLPIGMVCKGGSQPRRYCSTPGLSQTLTTIQARSFRSATNRRGHAGLAHAPVQENIIYDSMGGTQLFPQTQTSIYDPIPSGRPAPPLVMPHEEVKGSRPASTHRIATEAQQHSELNSTADVEAVATPAYHIGSKFNRTPYWQKIGRWKDIPEDQFLSYRWNVSEIFLCQPRKYVNMRNRQQKMSKER